MTEQYQSRPRSYLYRNMFSIETRDLYICDENIMLYADASVSAS